MVKFSFFYTFLFLIAMDLSIVSCTDKSNRIDVSQIKINTKLSRFEEEFYTAEDSDLQKIKEKYPYLFPIQTPDSVWLAQKNDSLSNSLFRETELVFGDFKLQHKAIDKVFKHVKYYYPQFKEPHIVTLISNLDLKNRIIYADSLLLVSLDTYLGKNRKYYANYPDYLQNNFDKEHISSAGVVAVALHSKALHITTKGDGIAFAFELSHMHGISLRQQNAFEKEVKEV